MHIRTLLATLTTLALTAAPALATCPDGSPGCVPEVGSTGSLAAIVAVAAVGMIIWERRRRAS